MFPRLNVIGIFYFRKTSEKEQDTESYLLYFMKSGLSSLGVPGVPWHTQSLADHLTLFQPRGTNYAHLITNGTSGFSDLPAALREAHID